MGTVNREKEAKARNAEAGEMVICEACYREGVPLKSTKYGDITDITCEDARDCVNTFAPELVRFIEGR